MKNYFLSIIVLISSSAWGAYEDMTLSCALRHLTCAVGLKHKGHHIWNDIYDYEYVIEKCMVEVAYVIENNEVEDTAMLTMLLDSLIEFMEPINACSDDFTVHQTPFYMEQDARKDMLTVVSKIEAIMGSRWEMLKGYNRKEHKIQCLKCFKKIPQHTDFYDIKEFLPKDIFVFPEGFLLKKKEEILLFCSRKKEELLLKENSI